MNRNAAFALAIGSLLSVGGCNSGVAAKSLSLRCDDSGSGGFPAMSLVYDGDATGTLSVTAPFGEMQLPATREEREGERDGAKYTVTGIRASRPASVLMPDRAELEACVAGKARGDAAQDADLVLMAIDSCRREVPEGKAAVPITATAEIALIDPPEAYVYLTLTFEEKSNVPGEHIAIETLPPPQCALTEP